MYAHSYSSLEAVVLIGITLCIHNHISNYYLNYGYNKLLLYVYVLRTSINFVDIGRGKFQDLKNRYRH